MEKIKQAAKTGFFSGLIGSLCCVTPLVLVLIGLSTVSGAMGLAGYFQQSFRWTLFIPVALVFLLASVYFQIKRKEGNCNLKTIKKHKVYILVTLGFAVVIWTLLIYALVPAIFSLLS